MPELITVLQLGIELTEANSVRIIADTCEVEFQLLDSEDYCIVSTPE